VTAHHFCDLPFAVTFIGAKVNAARLHRFFRGLILPDGPIRRLQTAHACDFPRWRFSEVIA
jgi:hypothetical protein